MKDRLRSLREATNNSKLLPKIIKNREVRNGHNITSNIIIDEKTGKNFTENIRLF